MKVSILSRFPNPSLAHHWYRKTFISDFRTLNSIKCNVTRSSLSPWGLLGPAADPGLPGPKPRGRQAEPGGRQVKVQVQDKLAPVPSLVPLPALLAVEHLELGQLKLLGHRVTNQTN